MIAIKDLTPERAGDWLAFFDGPGFADNPDWSDCYCMFFHFQGTNDEWNAACENRGNRAAQEPRLAAGLLHGYLAYDEDEPVGWVNAAPRTAYPKLDDFCPIDDPERTGTVVCFVVAATHRNLGVARSLLDAACEGFAKQGLSAAEAFPPSHPEAATIAADNYRGPLSMYESAGFTTVRRMERNIHVRKHLTG